MRIIRPIHIVHPYREEDSIAIIGGLFTFFMVVMFSSIMPVLRDGDIYVILSLNALAISGIVGFFVYSTPFKPLLARFGVGFTLYAFSLLFGMLVNTQSGTAQFIWTIILGFVLSLEFVKLQRKLTRSH